ncbi:MAG: COX5A-domain-containing protein [Olpidium bornovanus]|uniref:Cytochrome c oxidase subunit 6, mitochondrial n=1 Tax=Olpidium bornovanus TaxID=278681 RepID=A0A8H8DLX0_9FUNG|nr:MAG: COX5A-domain-containing protein [Olpidium bornovanus]
MEAFRLGARAAAFRAALVQPVRFPAANAAAAVRVAAQGRRTFMDESYDEVTTRYIEFFNECEENQELRRGCQNVFSYDLVPAPTVIEAALYASRRLNDFATAVRIFEALLEKTEDMKQYNDYLEVLGPLRKELGIPLREEMGYMWRTR